MSASVYYQPVKGKHLNIGAPSTFREMMERGFGSPPWTLLPEHNIMLEGMKAGTNQIEFQEALAELIRAVGDHNQVDVWLEY